MIYSIYGYGKGKTEAAVGLAIRALGNKDTVTFAQFLKDNSSTECRVLEDLGAEVVCTDTKDFRYTTDTRDRCEDLFHRLLASRSNLIIADEILVAYDKGFVNHDQLSTLIGGCRINDIDLCLTGRVTSKDRRQAIDKLSDISTNAYCAKHWYNTYCEVCDCEYDCYYEYCPMCGHKLVESEPSRLGRDY